MTREDDDAADEALGLPVDDAVEVVAAREDDPDPEDVRATLRTVAEDGVVSREGVRAAIADVSKVVATPENRVELAEMALSDAREAADAVSDLGAVRSRLAAFEDRLAAVSGGIDGLTDDLQELSARASDPEDVYGFAADVARVEARANELHGRADELKLDVEEFEAWLDDPERRLRELEDDADAVGEYLDGIERTAEGVEAGVPVDPAEAWFDAALRHAASELLVEDLRAELDDLRAWTDRANGNAGEAGDDGDGDARTDRVADRIDDLRGRWATAGDRLDALARPAWRDRFGDELSGFEATLAEYEPPVPWGELQAEVERRREAIGGAE